MLKTMVKFMYSISRIDFMKDYYRILGVKKNSSKTQIKNAYYKMAKNCHPDLVKGKQEQLKKLNQAYEVLGNQELKRQYDMGRQGESGNIFTNKQPGNYTNQQTHHYNNHNQYTNQNQNQYSKDFNKKQNPFYNQHTFYEQKSFYEHNFQENMKEQIFKAFRSDISQKKRQRDMYEKIKRQERNANQMFKKAYQRNIKEQQQRLRQYQQWKKQRKIRRHLDQQIEKQNQRERQQRRQRLWNMVAQTANSLQSNAKKIAKGAKYIKDTFQSMFKK